MNTAVHRFGDFELDLRSGRLFRGDVRVPLNNPQSAILVCLVTRAGQVVSKDTLGEAGWRGEAVTDVSVAQAVSQLRKALGSDSRAGFIETIPASGYRFTAPVTRSERRESRLPPDTELGPYRAFIHGLADLHTLNREAIVRARAAFEQALQSDRDYAPAHIGLANACTLLFEASCVDVVRDVDALTHAVHHARRATALAPKSGDAWSALAFALYPQGDTDESNAAAHKAIALEPDNWQHWLRLGFVSWGENRIRAARTMLGLCPGVALGHWLIATVLIARGALDAALGVLHDGCAAQDAQSPTGEAFPAVGLHLLRGQVLAAHQRLDEAAAALRRELASADSGQVYARECASNTWYALGGLARRQGRHAEANEAFSRALHVAPGHLSAAAALGRPLPSPAAADPRALDIALAHATGLACAGRHDAAADAYRAIVNESAVPRVGWILPVEPVIDPGSQPQVWADALAAIRRRAV